MRRELHSKIRGNKIYKFIHNTTKLDGQKQVKTCFVPMSGETCKWSKSAKGKSATATLLSYSF